MHKKSSNTLDSLPRLKLKEDSVNQISKRYLDSGKIAIRKPIGSVSRKKVTIHGKLINQGDYGAIPYYLANNSFPASLYKSNGTFNLKFGKIPLIADYFYSSPKYLTGLNNYFTIKFDVEAFNTIKQTEYREQANKIKTKIDSLSLQEQKYKQQLALLESKKINSFPQVNMPVRDSVPFPVLKNDSLLSNPYQFKEDSINAIYSTLDTSFTKIKSLENEINKTQQEIKQLNEKKTALENFSTNIPASNIPQTNSFLSGIKQLEVGMCYPSFSTFMVNQVALKGINTKYQYKKVFFDAAAGKTVVNYSIQPTTSAVFNQIRDLANSFDWSKNPNEKKISSVKLGYGNESKNYIAIGGLYGFGSSSPNSMEVKKNYVFEVDGRYSYKFLTFELAGAKSFLNQNSEPISIELYGKSESKNWNRSYQGKIFGTLPKVKTKISVLYRQVEPYFKSYGVGFMRSDISRIETKLEQPIGNRLKIGMNYRRDEDNLRSLFNYKTILETYTYYGRVRLLKKRMDVSLNYTEINQKINDLPNFTTTLTKSNIKTAIISYTPRLRKLMSTNTLVANLYELNSSLSRSLLESYSLSSFNQYRKWQINSINSYNQSNITDSLNFSNAINNNLELGFMPMEKLKITVGGKHAFSFKNNQSEYGYSLSANLNLNKLFNIEIKAEKLVIGDFMTTLNYATLRQYPYYGYIRLTTVF